MAGITFRGLLSRIEELERARLSKTYVEPYSRLTPEQRENPAIMWWVTRQPGVARWEFGQMMRGIFRDAYMWSGHHRCGHHSYYSSLSKEPECTPCYDSCALEAFRESEPFLDWFCEVMAWEDHDGRYLSLLDQRVKIKDWFTPYITKTMCPDWPRPENQRYRDRVKGEPIPYTLPDGFPLPTAEAVHRKRLEHWESCQRYGTEPTAEAAIEYMERKFGDDGNIS